ncbi:type IV secretion system protein VirD4 (plasmid) [Campylobacter fetus subsp. venerealis 97/608]|nr:type IV secretion system protein VirD4 [Campylobacter fetus subsp. venerealis 97/608]
MSIKSDNERSSAKGSFISPLTQFRSDNMRLATSGNDFDFRDLRKKKMTIFVGITPDQLTNAKLILNIFWQQLILVNTKELPQANKELKYPVMLLMDEFTASGYLATYLKGISFIAGYGLRSVMIYQSNSQLETNPPEGYGREGAKTLLTNHACQIYYTPREQEDAEKISKMLGTMTVKNRSRNLGQGGGGSESDASRALMLPQELREMKFEDELITIDNGKPILCNKAFYYSDPYFMNKFKAISPSLNSIKGIPSKKQLEAAIQNGETRIEIPTQTKEKLDLEQQIIRERIYTELLASEGDDDFMNPSEFLPDNYEGEIDE